MKLKFINLLLASGLLIGSAQVFTSCKDNESDLVADLTADADAAHKQLSDRIDKNEQELKNLETNLKGLISALETKLDQKTKDLEAAIKANSDKIDGVSNKVDGLSKDIEGLVKEIAGIKADIQVINDQITNINQTLVTINGTLTDYGTRIATLETTLTSVQATIANLNNSIESIKADIAALQDKDANLQSQIDALEAFKNQWATILPEIQQNAANALAKANANAAAVEALQNEVKATQDAIKALQGKDADLQSQIDKLVAESGEYATLADLNTAVLDLQQKAADYYTAAIGYTNLMCTALGVELKKQGEQLNNLQNAFDVTVEEFAQKLEILTLNEEALRQAIVLVGDDVANLHNLYDEFYQQFIDLKESLPEMISQITSVDATIAKLTSRIEDVANRITSIEIQQVHNPVLPSVNTPLGINTSILMAWMGDAARYCFPATSNGYTYNNQAPALKAADLALISKVCGSSPAVTPQTNANLVLTAENGEAYLGEVDLTVNPSNINLDKFTFNVARSNGETLPINLALTPSDKVLSFGISRTEANGFYEAAATIPVDQLSTVRFAFNQDLKTAVKNILTDPQSLKNKGAIALLLNAIANQLDGALPTLGVQASWSEDNNGVTEDHTVTSKYQIAATAVNPLSYQFLANVSLPTMPNLPDESWFKNWVNHWFDTMSGYVHINLGKANVHIEHAVINGDFVINIAPDLEVTVTIPPIAVDVDSDGDGIADGTGTTVEQEVVVSLNNIKEPIQNAMQDAIKNIAGELQTNVDELIDNLASQIQDIFDDLSVTVNDQIQDVLAKLQHQMNMNIDVITNRVHNFYQLVQNSIDRLNNVLKDPNHYLQPTLMYSAGNDFAQLSRIPALPSQFVLASGNAVMLIPTSLTGEVIAPAYQKYIAVTNVYQAADATKSAANGDATACSLMKAANAQQYMNEVIPGEIKAVPLMLQGASGYCYEIVYQAADYSGKVSDAKFYVVVK